MHLLVTRPEPDASQLREALAARGHSVTLEPLLRIAACAPPVLPIGGVGALVATSRNALRAIEDHPDLAAIVQLRLFTVGPGTARTAEALGFRDIVAGPAAARDLASVIAEHSSPGERLLHLAGDRLAYDLKSDLGGRGLRLATVEVYRTVAATALTDETATRITAGTLDGVVLMSPRTGEIFTDLMHRAGLTNAARGLTLFCLSPAVARAAAPLAGADVEVAAQPNSEELLALIARKAALSAAKS